MRYSFLLVLWKTEAAAWVHIQFQKKPLLDKFRSTSHENKAALLHLPRQQFGLDPNLLSIYPVQYKHTDGSKHAVCGLAAMVCAGLASNAMRQLKPWHYFDA